MSQPLTPSAYAVLGLLSFGRELTGYELKQWADSSLRFFYTAPAMSQIYTELDRLHGEGLVMARDREDGNRTIRTYRLSRRGATALRRWLRDGPVEPPVVKQQLALRVFLGHLAEPDRLQAQVADQRAWCEEMVGELRRVHAGLAADDTGTWDHARMVAEWGLEYYAGEVVALERLLAKLQAAAGALTPPTTSR